jgi:polyisoprenoid-binding protein YceI
MKRLVLVAAALSTMVASAAVAAPAKYKFDTVHTRVEFRVRHIFSKVPGRFNEFDGTLMFDEKSFPGSSVEFTIQAKSIDTNQERRDNDLRSANFFDVEKFPTLSFKSTKVTAPVDGKFKVEGELTMHGVTKPVTLQAEFLGAGPVAMGGRSLGHRAGFEATTTIDRKDYGIVWNQTLDQGGTLLGDDVAIELHVEAVREEPAAK